MSFVIQKHAARNLHYDFRLELGGVLLSWAVPKGPSLDPRDKRLAMQVEDHPLEYGEFEGVIPPKQYGAGTVMLWDRGTWGPIGDAAAAYAKGRLKFRLDGEKLKGGWTLVRTKGSKYGDGKQSWLLIKERDQYARQDKPVVERQPNSVASGRSMEKIARGSDRVWHSNRSVEANVRAGAVSPRRNPKSAASAPSEIAGIAISNPDKLMYPEAKLSKRDVALYYEAISDRLVPHLAKRPLSLVRCPDGWKGECFYQKHSDRSIHSAVERVEVRERNGMATYLAAGSASGVVALAQWGVLELHPWGSRVPKLECPDRLIFDFDPDDSLPWKSLVDAVVMLRALLDDLGLEGFLKTTGGKGLHIVLPIRPTLDWDTAKGFTRAISEELATTFPVRFTSVMSKAQRKGKIFIDYLRNSSGATAVAAYSLRARANAPVATPIGWSELERDLRFDYFNIRTVLTRLEQQKEDPWAGFFQQRQSVTKSMLARVRSWSRSR